MISPDRQELRDGVEIPSQDEYTEGLNRRRPPEAKATAIYRKGFRKGMARDFDLYSDTPHYYNIGVPKDQESYDAFLTGLACADEPRLPGERALYNYNRPPIERSYELGLELLLNHLGYPEKTLKDRVTYIRRNPELLKFYREKALASFQDETQGIVL